MCIGLVLPKVSDIHSGLGGGGDRPHGELETTIMTHEQQSALLCVFCHSSL